MLPQYHIVKKMCEHNNSLVYRGIRRADNQPVILKVLRKAYPTPTELLRYHQEFTILQRFNTISIIKAYDLAKYQNTVVLVLEDFGGQSLAQQIAQQPLTLPLFLPLAIQITQALSEIHAERVIHKDINPANMVWNPTTQQLKIIDFSIATELPRENPLLKNPQYLEGTLAYIAPEQTGRMNCSVDYRSDLYALGVTFYELLTGQLPFNSQNSLELVHCHIAKTPPSPHQLNPNIPPLIADLVMKLLAKNLENRYQSAFGVKADLTQYVENSKLGYTDYQFALAQQDCTGQLRISQRLYGRDQEIATLLQAFDRVSQGSAEMMLVAGYSGVGKSALVYEVHKPMTAKQGYFAAGKFDQYQRNIPYSALSQAFNAFCHYLLTEDDQALQQWRTTILQAVGDKGQILIEVIPDLALVIGEQPPVAVVSPQEAQNRFLRIFQDFLQAICQAHHPLLLFIDDWQWADSASLTLLESLLISQHYLLVICAYRDNEVDETHPFKRTLQRLQQQPILINTIQLHNLQIQDVNAFIADTLHEERQRVQPLANLIYIKTLGNAFFTTSLLQTLYEEALLRFDPNTHHWHWQLADIQHKDLADNVVDLMVKKIQRYPTETQQVLKRAASIGNPFDLLLLAVIAKRSPQQTLQALWVAIADHLVVPLDDHYKLFQSVSMQDALPKIEAAIFKFQHDRIQQAAYALIDVQQKPQLHLEIGRLLLQNTATEAVEKHLFDIVEHFNLGLALLTSRTERQQIAQLSLRAGQKAKLALAYGAALRYLNGGLTLLAADSWQTHYDLTLNLHIATAEAAYLTGDFAQQQGLTKVVLQRAKTLLDKVTVYEVQVQAYIAQTQLREAVKTVLQATALAGVPIAETPTASDIEHALAETQAKLIDKSILDLADLPLVTDAKMRMVMRLLASANAPAYTGATDLFPLIIAKQINLCIEYGNTEASSLSYAFYGALCCGDVTTLEMGYQFGQVALKLLARFNDQQIKARTMDLVYGMIQGWKQPLSATLPPLEETYHIARENGAFEYAGYSILKHCYYAFLVGEPLSTLQQKLCVYSQALEQLKQFTAVNYLQRDQQALLNLINGAPQPSQLTGEIYDEGTKLPLYQQAQDHYGLLYFYLDKLILSYLFQETIDQTLACAEQTEAYLAGGHGLALVAVFYFYDSLTRLRAYPQAAPTQQAPLLEKVVANQAKMAIWAQQAPMNFQHKYDLVAAEQARLKGEAWQSIQLYERSITGARTNAYLPEEALAYELAGLFYRQHHMDPFAQVYLREAQYRYQQWGALAKATALAQQYPDYLESVADPTSATTTTITTESICLNPHSTKMLLDFNTVIKASQTLSEEIELSHLLTKMMKIVLENAGAEKGLLLLPQEDKWFIEAESHLNQPEVSVLQSIALDQTRLAMTVLHYVIRTQKDVVLADATRIGQFTLDPYVTAHQPKSILCTPLLNQRQITGILYLENNLTTHAFTADRLELLHLLSVQMAISIKNAKLYTEVRESEKRLAQFLEAIPVGAFVADMQGHLHYLNQTAQQILGKGLLPDTTIEQLPEVYHAYITGTSEPYPVERLPLVRALQGEKSTIEDMEIQQPHRKIPLEVWGTPIFDERDRIVYAMTAFRDITERKQAEEQRTKFIQELGTLNATLAEHNSAYERFVPHEFLSLLDKPSVTEVKLGDQVEKEMTVLFSDIRCFTTLSETMTPKENFRFINSYLSHMAPIIRQYHGFIDKYIGDAIMALFPTHADDALQSAIAMLTALGSYNKVRQKNGHNSIKIGIGINTGPLMLGTVGEATRMDGTVISDAVNLAARIEEMTKEYGTALLISKNTYSQLSDPSRYAIRPVGHVKVKGKLERVTVYEVFDGDSPTAIALKQKTLSYFEQALTHYYRKELGQARQCFQQMLQIFPEDKIAQIYLNRCEQLQKNGVLEA